MSAPMRWNVLSLAFLLVVLGLSWAAMPSGEVAIHFGGDGQPDSFGSRNGLVGGLTAAFVATWLFMAWLSSASDRLPWSMVNIPRKDHWSRPEHEPVARERLSEDLSLVNVGVTGLFAALCPVIVVSVRRGEMTGALEVAALGLPVAFCVALGVVLWRRNRFYRDVPVDGDVPEA